ncbi:RHS repeat-associated core domain-containing protein [Xanthomonas sacchari]|uniref:RHS repeat-associated core domain-containing protein n=1 Tax=Xanthomonas sacchari TaxID=56458 RepID=UPI00225115C7|nr:RHS repeat-associated core domain-containing protein [Xanthomonas sacchari]
MASFSYDALGRRIAKTEGGTTTQYLYDGLDAVQETQGGTVNPILTGPGIDQRFARNDNGGRTYFLTDLLGSTRLLTDTAGTAVQRYDYDPYGATTQSSASFTNPYQYTGRERDANGLYYYRARYYKPEWARFIGEDPIGLAGGSNLYAYVHGSPVSLVDPDGLAPKIPSPNVVPGGPWEPHKTPARAGQFLGPPGQGGRPLCQYVPPHAEGGPPGSNGYWKVNSPGQKGWQRYSLDGKAITAEEAHPKPTGSPNPPIPPIPPSIPSPTAPIVICPLCQMLLNQLNSIPTGDPIEA